MIHQSPISTLFDTDMAISRGTIRFLALSTLARTDGTKIMSKRYIISPMSNASKIRYQNQMKMYVFSLTMFKGRMHKAGK